MTAAGQDSSGAAETTLDTVLDRRLPPSVRVGEGTALFCIGTCFHPRRSIEELTLVLDGERHRPTAHGMPRPDRFRALHPDLPAEDWGRAREDPRSSRDPELRSYRSGFWATIPVSPRRSGELELRAEARLDDGSTAESTLGAIPVVEPGGPPPLEGLPDAAGGIAICMATFNPNLELLKVQIDSIRAQTEGDWVCIVSDDHSRPDRFESIKEIIGDDPRFVLSRSEERLGFYRNFERVLELVPANVELVALCDHDDYWYPDKLETLRGAIGDAEFVYSKQRLVDGEGRVRGETLWQERSINHTNLASLLISNTVIGASSLFRRRVIDHALPFPGGPPGWHFHDHWLALVALTLGEIAHVDRPLYDYVQHPGAVTGNVATRPPKVPRSRLEHLRELPQRWRAAYFGVYLDRAYQAQVLLTRCGTTLAPRKLQALRLMIAADRSPMAFLWLLARPARALIGRNETLGFESVLAKGIVWRHLLTLAAAIRPRPADSAWDASLPPFDAATFGSKRIRRWLARA